MKRHISLAIAALLASQLAATAADQIKIGMPMILSGPGALFGEPTLKGAQMYVDEVNAQGGVLGKKLQLISKDSKGNADEAVRVAREMVLKDEVDFIVGTFTAAEGPAVSPIAKENKIVFIAPVSKPEALMSPAEHSSLYFPYLHHDDDRRPLGGGADRQAGRQARRDHESRLCLRTGSDRGVRRASQEDQAGGGDRRSAVAQARRGRLHAVHQRPAFQEAGSGVQLALGRPFRDLHQAGQAARLFRRDQIQLHRRRRSRLDRIGQGDRRRLSARDLGQRLRHVPVGRRACRSTRNSSSA